MPQSDSTGPPVLQITSDPTELGELGADVVVKAAAASSDLFLLGCPGGRSAQPVYRALARRAAAEHLDLSRWVIVMMDEYLVVGPGGELVAVDPSAPHSCRGFGERDIVETLNAGLPEAHRIPPAALWLPDPADPGSYDQRIAAAGGVDVFLLATGASDGHIAFNPPGVDRHRGSHVVELPESTRRDNLATFPSFGGDLDRVPRHGVTVGVGTIADVSKQVVMLVHGADKQLALRRLTAATGFDPDWPATIYLECARPTLIADHAAASGGLLVH